MQNILVTWILIQILMLDICAGMEHNNNNGGSGGGGYHPSAEEFDNLMRGTRTWTRDILAADRRRLQFVPRYHHYYHHHQQQHQQQQQQQDHPWWISSTTTSDGQKWPTNADGTLDFHMFGDDTDDNNDDGVSGIALDVADVEHQVAQIPSTTAASLPSPAIVQHVQSELIKVGGGGGSQSTSASAAAASDHQSFPIFFTNPATGIVYAISEVGRDAAPGHNDSIPIYVTKQQYDNDLEALRQRYKNLSTITCRPTTTARPSTNRPSINRPSTNRQPPTTTARPQIIQLSGPTSSSSLAIASNKLPMSYNKKPNINGGVQRPTRKTKTRTKVKRKSTKKKKKRKPGHRATTTATQMPQIIQGKRQSNTTTTTTTTRTTTTTTSPSPIKLSTQLEKPRMPPTPDTVFSQRPFVVSTGIIDLRDQRHRHHPYHRLSRRSVDSVAARKVSTPSRRSRLGSKTKTKSTTTRGKSLPLPSPPPPPSSLSNKIGGGVIPPYVFPLLHHHSHGNNDTTTVGIQREDKQKIIQETNRKTKKKGKEKKKKKKDDNGFDLLDMMITDDDDNDDDYYYYYDDDDDDDDDDKKEDKIKPELSETLSSSRNESNTSEINTMEEEMDSSSAEEGVDFGAMEEETMDTKDNMSKKRIRRRPSTTNANTISIIPDDDKSNSESHEDYSDNDDDGDDEDEGGIGGFFRMIFYPVQVAMSRIFNDPNDDDDDDGGGEQGNRPTKPKYPQYTLYHNNAHSKNDYVDANDDDGEDGEDEKSPYSSLSNWLSSWFGFHRQTKKIGASSTTTKAPPPPPPSSTASSSSERQPIGWLESLFGFGAPTAIDETSIEDDYDKWFSSWFESKPKPKGRRRTTSTTTTTTVMPTPQVPILTIVDPMRNPQNWIGILAHHIVNSTTTTTSTSRPITTTDPDIPHRITYDKWQIWSLKPQDEAQVRTLEQIQKSEDGNKLHWLKGPSLRGLTDVLVPPKMLVDFQGTLNFENIAHEVLIFDVGKVISYERNKEEYMLTTPSGNVKSTKKPRPSHYKYTSMSWNKYHSYDDILAYLETIRMRHSQLVELIHIGRSYEGRPLVVVKIEPKAPKSPSSSSATQAQPIRKHHQKYKRKSSLANAIFIEAGAHGLAWIGPAAATWMINEILRILRSNSTATTDENDDFIRNTTWYIMPVLNPDGYAYSHEYDRFWKKSRSRHVAKPAGGIFDSAMTWLQQKPRRSTEKVCFGVDLDRNWHYHWGRRGSSKSACNEFYAGPAPFSEPETRSLSEFLMDYRTQIKLYISMQAYGQVVSYPIKANSTFNTERVDDFLDVAMVGTDGLRKKGSKSRYKVDSANDLIEHRSGCADAFAAYEIGIPFSYTLQLADNGVHGYLLPSSAIEATARDAFEIVSSMLDYI